MVYDTDQFNNLSQKGKKPKMIFFRFGKTLCWKCFSSGGGLISYNATIPQLPIAIMVSFLKDQLNNHLT